MNYAPVIVFNYNRPDHSLRTWEALSQNRYAVDTELFLYCDGPKRFASNATIAKIEDVKKTALSYAKNAKIERKFKDVHVVFSENNKGLANSIIGGVTEVVEKYDRVIVLEDDLLTSPYFLKYMNEALDYYSDRMSVISICANRPPTRKMSIPKDYQYDVFVSLRPFSTGWATWRNRWDKMDWSLDYLPAMLKDKQWVEAFNRGGDDLTNMLCDQRDGKIDSWAIRWAYSHFKEHCISILPCVPYVDNIGFDGTGIHSGTDERDYRNDVYMAVENPRLVETLYEDSRIINAFASCYARNKRPLYQRMINTICRKLGQEPLYAIKKKVYVNE